MREVNQSKGGQVMDTMDAWQKVYKYTERAKLIGFDECHKIYIATDKHEADYFTENGWETFSGTPSEMADKLHEWYEASCGLRFISAVKFDKKTNSTKFTTLVPQS